MPQSAFQFTRPAWGATGSHRLIHYEGAVSIHAPRVGRDISAILPTSRIGFNSRAPRGARHPEVSECEIINVSIHAPRVGRDEWHKMERPETLFQFTRPAWGATQNTGSTCCRTTCFNSRAPRGARQSAFD
mgnify:CR=1 FL=1